MRSISREDIIKVLVAWQTGAIGPTEVHEWAEERYASSNFEPEDDVTSEVLSNLDCLDINLTTLEDVPTFLQMLQLPQAQSDEAFRLLREHGDSVDINERMRRYANDPFYGRFCAS